MIAASGRQSNASMHASYTFSEYFILPVSHMLIPRTGVPRTGVHHYLCHRLASGEGIVSLDVRLSRCVCVRCISLGGVGNAQYPVLSCSINQSNKQSCF